MVEEKLEKVRGDGARRSLAGLVSEWRGLFERCVNEAETFTREKPSVGLAAAFLTGFVLGSLFRRR